MKKGVGIRILLIIAMLVANAVGISVPSSASAAQGPKAFSSIEEINSYIQRNVKFIEYLNYGNRRFINGVATTAIPKAAMSTDQKTENASVSTDYSKTNIQVEGVDEADLVKSDGQYLYVVSGNDVVIVNAYPTAQAKIVSRVKIDGNPEELFINGNRMAVFGYQSNGNGYFARVYDITDRTNPVVKRDLETNGTYVTSRMVGDYIYLVGNNYVNYGDSFELPKVTVNSKTRVIPPNQIYYFDYGDESYQYTQLMAFNISNDQEDVGIRTYLTGVSQNVFASQNNIYLTGAKSPDYNLYTNKLLDGLAGLLPATTGQKIKNIKASQVTPDQKIQQAEDVLQSYIDSLDYDKAAVLQDRIESVKEVWRSNLERERNKTAIYKLAVKQNNISCVANGEVPGQVLNQFSMDEHNGYFRIATTSESSLLSDQVTTRNNIYVLDSTLKIIGKLQGLAPTERIYSARFMGNRAYLVTFRQVDPLYVIDLSAPKNPKVLGYLKIPGYSDYLQPYDETHLIGMGKEVQESSIGPVLRSGTAVKIMPPILRPQGVKVAMFDVSNPAQPKEISKYDVEGYSNSIALSEHKAVLFDRAKGLLVIPIDINQRFWITQDSTSDNLPWHGVYVFKVLLDQGITLQGKIAQESNEKDVYQDTSIKRSLYIKDVLYTVSDQMIKMNSLTDLKEVNKVKLQ